jgi:hypothetical protein
MRALAVAVLVAAATTACSKGNDAAQVLATVAPPLTAPERSAMPEKCKVATTFDQGCVGLFDQVFGNGAGFAERGRLNVEHDRSWPAQKSTAKPAPRLGSQP